MLKIKNWFSFQSYKDRKPPWIRFHKSMLDNFEYHALTAEARALLPMLWLLASEDDDPVSGLIRFSYEKIAFRLRMQKAVLEKAIKELLENNFIETVGNPQCNESVTNPYSICTQTVTPETEIETETETEKRHKVSLYQNLEFENFWKLYPKKIEKKKSQVIYEKAIKSGATHQEILEGLNNYLTSRAVKTGYIANATTWLNGERWKDEPDKSPEQIKEEKWNEAMRQKGYMA